jgi:hypothetical protein
MIKSFKATLILDWKKNDFRIIKKYKKTKIVASEIPIHLEIDVEIPEETEIKATGKIVLSQERVGQIVLDQL